MGWRVLVAVLTLGCTGGDASLRVDLRTDFVPGVEFTEVRTVIDDDVSETRMFAIRDELFDAGRIASFDSVPAGEHRVQVTLIGQEGELATRSVRVQIQGNVGITVLMTRDCRGVSCPGAGDDISALSCLGGTCVPEDCIDGTSPDCPEPECTNTGDCTMAALCTAAECVEGTCVYRRDDSLCNVDEYCDPDDGCTRIPVTGEDAGSDAGSTDVGFDGSSEDAGTDAGVDAGSGDWIDPLARSRVVIELAGTGTAPLDQVPVVVRLNASNFDFGTAMPDGSDIRFFAEGELLAHEIELFEATSAWIWVTLPRVEPGPTRFEMYWGGSGFPARPAVEVWGPEFVAVHHMNDDRDSTVNDNAAGWVGVVPESGSLGPNAAFRSPDLSHMHMPPSPTLAALDQITLSAVVRHRNDQPDWRSVIARQLGATPENDLWLGFNENRFRGVISSVDTPVSGPYLTGPDRPLDTSVHLAVTYDGANAILYADGAEVAAAGLAGTLLSSPNPIWIGADANGDPSMPDTDFIDARIDELRIQRVPRSREWIMFQSQVLAQTVLTYLPIESR